MNACEFVGRLVTVGRWSYDYHIYKTHLGIIIDTSKSRFETSSFHRMFNVLFIDATTSWCYSEEVEFV